jgi:hypothetical protein
MKRTIISLILLLVFCLWLSGCGGDTGGFYTAEVSFTDGEDNTLTIDVIKDICGTYKQTESPKEEDFYDVFANITVSVAENMPGLTVRGYSTSYIPLMSATGVVTGIPASGGLMMPPALQPLNQQGANNIHIDSNSASTFTILCFSKDQKQEYSNIIGWTSSEIQYTTTPASNGPDGIPGTADDVAAVTLYELVWGIPNTSPYAGLGVSRYTFRIVLHCTDDSGADRDIEILKSVYLGWYDRC